MTTIAVRRLEDGKKGKPKGVVFACDDQVTRGYQKFGAEAKIFKRGPVTFGFAGAVRDMNLLQYSLKMPKFDLKAENNPRKWVVTKLIPAIQKTLEDNGSLETDKGYSSSDSHLIIAVKGLCGYVGQTFSLAGTEEDMWAVGTGSEYAIGAMTFGATPREAVAVAGLHDIGTGNVHQEVVVKW